ncbi:MAG: HAMP domain-containing sensor histidine kinase [Pseudomonadota bacterium]
MFKSLSGRFLLLTVLFVMLAEILIFLPSVARYRVDYLQRHIELSHIASFALLAEDMLDESLETELLENTGVYNVVVRNNQMRELVLASPMPQVLAASYDLRNASAFELIRDAILRLVRTEDQVIRVISNPKLEPTRIIEITMGTEPLRDAMINYGFRILILSAMISVVTAFFLFLAVRSVLVTPIKRVVSHMQSYASQPEDARRIIVPESNVTELREAEEALQSMQTQLTGSLRQKDRLAQLGSAVAKVSHDLRNILTTAQLFADRVEASEDPAVARVVPKLVNSIQRAVHLCEGTLAFGKSEEPPPALSMVKLEHIVDDVVDSERLACETDPVTIETSIAPGMVVRADGEQLYRVLSNLVRNARQAIAATKAPGSIRIVGKEDDEGWSIDVIDTGPGLPAKAQQHLFQPFQGGARKGGTGLGLAIAVELIRGHGGELSLTRTGPDGTQFQISLPKAVLPFEAKIA